MSTNTRYFAVVPLLAILSMLALAQAPTGQIDGRVLDETGALVPGTTVTLTNTDTGASRRAASGGDGSFSFPSLQAGKYEIRCEAKGFRTQIQVVTVATGSIATAEMHLQVGQAQEVVTVEALAAQLSYDRHTIDGVVTKQQIDSLPLNGRSFLQLAQLQPGVSVSPANIGEYNRQFDVNILGAGSESVRITVDGATVNDSVTGGTQQNFSQEVVQEFQVSSVNFDLSTGITAGGAVNVITRTGSNDFHGSGFFYFRDHNMAAYPYLSRDPLQPDPFFARRQPGFYLGGPIKKEKLFFFTSYEHINQRGVFSTEPTDPLFAAFLSNAGTPYHSNQFTQRFDYRINDKHSAFLRYSHDGNNAYSPTDNSQPSNWGVNTNYADSGVFSLISAFTPSVVNEFRYSMTFWDNKKNTPTASICPSPCFGLGGPQFNIHSVGGFQIGNNASNTPQSRVLRRHIFADNITLQKGSHSLRLGGEWEYQQGTGTYAYLEPGGAVLYAPEDVQRYDAYITSVGLGAYAIKIPSSFTTYQDILQLPLAGFETAVGDINQPPSYNRGNADHNHRLHFYAQDTWKMKPNFTLIYGLGWSYESNLLNFDLTKPQYLQPILGANGLAHEQHSPKNWSPALGFAWNVGHDNKTVIRAGGGIYYDTMNIEVRLLERAAIGPLGTGRVILGDSVFFSTIDNIFGINAQLPGPLQVSNFQTFPTTFTGADFVAILPALRAGASQQLHQNPTNTDLTIRNINIFKQAPGLDMFVPDFQPPLSQHASIGVQRQITSDLSVSADFVYRHILHTRIRNADLNHFYSANGPVIPPCTSAAQAADPAAECSTGEMTFDISGGRSTYKGLLVRVDKRLTHHLSFVGSYAFQDLRGYNGIALDSNWFASNGPQMGRQSLTFSGTYQLPWGFEISTIATFGTRGPVQPFVGGGIDLYGDGSGADQGGVPLPGVGYNEFNITKGSGDLVKAITAFNQQYGGKTTPIGQPIPTLTVPSNYSWGRNGTSEDFRVTKKFKLHGERFTAKVFGEVFNAFNYANLGGYSYDLTNPASFGVPTSRAGQVFGSGGPRAFQLGARLEF
jgi:outer membrane receptor for ferrienterochelin and colicin